MSDRTEKEQRRQARLAAEAEAQAAADRRKRLGLVGGVVLLVAVIAVVAVAIAGSGGDSSTKKASDPGVTAPNFHVTDLAAAAKAAQCKVTLSDLPDEGRGHTTAKVRYKTNPPTSGAHNPTPAEDGIYDPGNPPVVEQ